VYKNIVNYFKSIRKKPEKVRIKVMWAFVAFFMIVVVGIWWIDFSSNKYRNINFDRSALSSLYNLQSDIISNVDEIERHKDEFLEQLDLDIGTKRELEEVVRNYAKENGIMEGEDFSDLRLKKMERLENSWYISYDQYYNGVLVNGSNIYFVVDDKKRKVVSYNSNFDPSIEVNVKPKITKDKAYDTVAEYLRSSNNSLKIKDYQLVIYKSASENRNKYRLTWKINVFSKQTFNGYYCFIDAHKGNVVSCHSSESVI
jgi:Zn-dependent metalloprotease